MKILFFLLSFVLTVPGLAQETTPVWAQLGYKIDFKVKGIKDTTALLVYYFGESTFPRDTARVNGSGEFSFEGNQRLREGMYVLVFSKTRIVDFLVSKDQHFALETDASDYYMNMKVKGDEDNDLYFKHLLYNAERHKEAEPFRKIIQDTTVTEAQRNEAKESFGKLYKTVVAREDEIIATHPTSLTARLLKKDRQIQVPDPPKRADGTIDSTFQLRYYREHYFDNFDLGDESMLCLPKPLYQDKVSDYLDKLFLQQPDTIMKAIDHIALKAKKNKETYKYLLWSCIFKYQRPTIMGMDEVFVRVYDKYFAQDNMGISPSVIKNVKDHAEKIRYSLIGKTGANLMMQDQNLQPKSLYDIKKKYSLIYIFDPDCGHCREETPKLVSFYATKKEKYALEVFAVCIDSTMQKMKNYIKEMKMTWTTVNGPRSYLGPLAKSYFADTTPMLYILDDKKKIIAKGLPVEKLDEFFTSYELFMSRKASPKGKGS